MSGLWKQCFINLQRPAEGCPCAEGCADKAVICSGGLGSVSALLREREPGGSWGRISLQLLLSPLHLAPGAGSSEHGVQHKGTEMKEPREEHRAYY